jgi:hypothetical protein
MIAFIAQVASRVIGSTFLGIIIPAAVFFVSFYLSYRLYKYFTGKTDDSE